VETCIERHLPKHQFEVLKAAEKSEREFFLGIVDQLEGSA